MLTNKRKLGHTEAAMYFMQKAHRGTTQVSQYVTLSKKITEDLFKNSVRYLFDSYAPLRSIILFDGNTCYLHESAQFEDIEIETHTLGSTETLDQYLIDQVEISLNPEKNLWRVILVDGPQADEQSLLMICHHSIIDASALFDITKFWLTSIDEAISTGTFPSTSSQPTPPAVDEYLIENRSPRKITPLKPIPHEKIADINERKISTYKILLPEDDFISQCKNEKITLNSLIVAAMSIAVSDKYEEENIPFKTAISIRDCLNTGKTKLGCYLGIGSTILQTKNKSIVEIAKEYEQKLMMDVLTNVTSRLDNNHQELNIKIESTKNFNIFYDGIGITNLGKIPIPSTYKNFAITKFYTVVNRLAGNGEFVAQVFIFNKIVTIDLVYVSPLVSETRIKSVSEKMHGQFNSFIKVNEKAISSEYLTA